MPDHAKPNPLNVDCPACGRAAGSYCYSISADTYKRGAPLARAHVSRYAAARKFALRQTPTPGSST